MARLRPSAAARLVQCPGSMHLCETYKAEDTDATLEGTAAHEVAVSIWDGVPVLVGGTAANGVEITQEMIEAAAFYISVIKGVVFYDDHRCHIENTVINSALHPCENGGTPDAWWWDMRNNTLHIFDFKYGHKYVEVFENWQLINYAALILKDIELQEQQSIKHVVMHIVQPRSYHRDGSHRTWSVNRASLTPYFIRLRAVFELATSVNPMTVTGIECEFCDARRACHALKTIVYQIAEVSSDTIPVDMEPEAIGTELRKVREFKARIEALETGLAAQVESMIKNKQPVPGWSIEPTYGREKWTDEQAVQTMADLLGINVSKPTLITPKQAIAAGLPDDVVRKFSVVPTGSGKLTCDVTQIRKIFYRG